MKINESIKLVIKQRKVNQTDLAAELGVLSTSLSGFLNGHRNMTQEKIEKLCELLNLELREKEDANSIL